MKMDEEWERERGKNKQKLKRGNMKVNGKLERNEREKGNETTRKRGRGKRVRKEKGEKEERKVEERKQKKRYARSSTYFQGIFILFPSLLHLQLQLRIVNY